MARECGCKVNITKFYQSLYSPGASSIEYCALHALAPDMLFALGRIKKQAKYRPEDYMSTEEETLFFEAQLGYIAELADECLKKYVENYP